MMYLSTILFVTWIFTVNNSEVFGHKRSLLIEKYPQGLTDRNGNDDGRHNSDGGVISVVDSDLDTPPSLTSSFILIESHSTLVTKEIFPLGDATVINPFTTAGAQRLNTAHFDSEVSKLLEKDVLAKIPGDFTLAERPDRLPRIGLFLINYVHFEVFVQGTDLTSNLPTLQARYSDLSFDISARKQFGDEYSPRFTNEIYRFAKSHVWETAKYNNYLRYLVETVGVIVAIDVRIQLASPTIIRMSTGQRSNQYHAVVLLVNAFIIQSTQQLVQQQLWYTSAQATYDNKWSGWKGLMIYGTVPVIIRQHTNSETEERLRGILVAYLDARIAQVKRAEAEAAEAYSKTNMYKNQLDKQYFLGSTPLNSVPINPFSNFRCAESDLFEWQQKTYDKKSFNKNTLKHCITLGLPGFGIPTETQLAFLYLGWYPVGAKTIFIKKETPQTAYFYVRTCSALKGWSAPARIQDWNRGMKLHAECRAEKFVGL